LTFIRKDLFPVTLLDIQRKFNLLGLEITVDMIKFTKSHQNSLIIVGIYRPPNSKKAWFDVFQELINSLTPLGNIILLGDLNCNLFNVDSYVTKNFLNLIELGQLYIPAVLPTRIGLDSVSALDIIAISKNISLIEYKLGDINVSDHIPVEACLEIVFLPVTIKPILRRNFKKIDYSRINKDLLSISFHNLNQDDPNVLLSHWNLEVEKILDNYAPLKQYPSLKKHNNFLPADIIELINVKKHLLNKLKHSPFDTTLITQLKIQQKKLKVTSLVT
jgi:hypothetical protein